MFVASFLIWNIVLLGATAIPTKEKGMNETSFDRIKKMIAEDQKEEALKILGAYMEEYEVDSYQAALLLYASTLETTTSQSRQPE